MIKRAHLGVELNHMRCTVRAQNVVPENVIGLGSQEEKNEMKIVHTLNQIQMKELFETIAEHPWVSLFLAIVIFRRFRNIGSAISATQIVVADFVMLTSFQS